MTARPDGGGSRVERVFQGLRSDIFRGVLHPGQRLPFADLVNRYECSTGVVREALQRLAAQGFVEAQPQQGFRVVTVSAEDLLDLTQARVEIETLALRYAVGQGDTEWEAQLMAAHHRLSQARQFDDDGQGFSEQWANAHTAFHTALLSGCANRRLLGIATALRESAELYWRRSAPAHERDRDIAGEHRAILEATIARDADRAAQLLAAHIARTTDALLGEKTERAADGSTTTSTLLR